MQNIPPFIFYEKRTLCDPLVSLAFEAVGGFHDAALDDCSFFIGGVKIRFWEPYFYDQRQYNQFGVKGGGSYYSI
ncbi:hypothetical protein [Cypionkella sp.]|uniref:hypothetical protein n=1 Tax=Cypionkella sp. TaxID=2811411 RepID=UPI002ABC9557|nr:hypothetical protein [Cypionkella sp.]MDZ4392463.1 hypothetical protein [Cypionkella sp.]